MKYHFIFALRVLAVRAQDPMMTCKQLHTYNKNHAHELAIQYSWHTYSDIIFLHPSLCIGPFAANSELHVKSDLLVKL